MLRPLALIGTAGLMAMTISAASAQQASSCPNCDNGGTAAAPTYTSGTWHYADCEECDNGHCHGCLGCFNNCGKAWPDKNWNPPARLPVNRDGIWYHNYWPQAWYGNPGGGFISDVPMVYQPTDTTQLGYSYAKVPTWTTQNNMLPPTPCPSHFHSRVCVPRPCPCRRHIDGCPAQNPCLNGNCQNCQQGYAAAAAMPYGNGQISMMPVEAAAAPVSNTNVTPQQTTSIRRTSGRNEGGFFSLATLKKMFN